MLEVCLTGGLSDDLEPGAGRTNRWPTLTIENHIVMKAWMLDPTTKRLELCDKPTPNPRRGGVTVRVEAAMVLAYMKELLAGARGHAPLAPYPAPTASV